MNDKKFKLWNRVISLIVFAISYVLCFFMMGKKIEEK